MLLMYSRDFIWLYQNDLLHLTDSFYEHSFKIYNDTETAKQYRLKRYIGDTKNQKGLPITYGAMRKLYCQTKVNDYDENQFCNEQLRVLGQKYLSTKVTMVSTVCLVPVLTNSQPHKTTDTKERSNSIKDI